MTAKKTSNCLLLACTVLGLTGCLGGDSQVAGIEGTGDTVSVSGSVTAFGSVFVNGTRYDTDTADVWIDGSLATEADLVPGMVVKVEASKRDGVAVASSLEYDRLLYGPIATVDMLDATRKQLQVLGQTVVVGEDAAFEGLGFDDIAPGMVVAISGLPAGDGTHLATRIVLSDNASLDQTWDLEGPITSVDGTQATLRLGGLQVDYSNALFEGGQRDRLAAGVRVEIEGSLADASLLLASRIRFVAPVGDASSNNRLSFEGVITSFESARSLVVNGIAVDTSGAAYARGAVAQLRAGARVAVAGYTNATGTVVADSVALILPNEARLRGPIEIVNSASGRLRVLGTTFATDAYTVYQDRSSATDRYIGVDTLSDGETVEIYGRSFNGRWIATRILRIDALESVSIKGPVTAIDGTTLSVMGVAVDASGAEGVEQLDGLQAGTVVTAEGHMTGSASFEASRLEVHFQQSCSTPVNVGCSPGDLGEGRPL